MFMEFRVKSSDLICEEGSLKVGGYINVTERESEILYSKTRNRWFKETIKQGVFQRALDNASEIPMLLEHNWDSKLANTLDGSLTLKEDNVGLKFEAVINNEEVYSKVRSGEINSCSFGFRALKEDIEPVDSKLEKRFVTEIELLEVSLVSNPAYVGSLAEVRAYEEALQMDKQVEETETKEVSEVIESEPEVEAQTTEAPAEPEVVEDTEKNIDETVIVSNEMEAEDSDKRHYQDTRIEDTPSSTEVEVDKEYLKTIVNELIDAKLEQVQEASINEEIASENLDYVKQENESIENHYEEELAQRMTQTIKLKLELLKLKDIERGI